MHTEFSLGSLREKRPLRKPRSGWVDNIKIGVEEIRLEVWD
jgi:hypothetical protein